MFWWRCEGDNWRETYLEVYPSPLSDDGRCLGATSRRHKTGSGRDVVAQNRPEKDFGTLMRADRASAHGHPHGSGRRRSPSPESLFAGFIQWNQAEGDESGVGSRKFAGEVERDRGRFLD